MQALCDMRKHLWILEARLHLQECCNCTVANFDVNSAKPNGEVVNGANDPDALPDYTGDQKP